MIELNLLPDVKLQYVRAVRARRRVISVVSVGGFISVGLVVLFALYVYAFQPIRGVVLDNGIKDSEKKLSEVKDLNNLLTIQQQLADLPALHEAKPMYSRFIGYLSVLNPNAPNSVRVTQLAVDAVDDRNTLTIQAYAPTYTAATVYESTLRSAQFTYTRDDKTTTVPLFTSVRMTDTALGQDSNGNRVATFTVTVTTDENVFAFDTLNPSVTVPTKNATSSAQNVPEVFAEAGGTQ